MNDIKHKIELAKNLCDILEAEYVSSIKDAEIKNLC